MPDMADTLEAETSGFHARLGTLPFFTALAAVRDWFVDDGRFSTDWIANMHKLVERLDEAAEASC